MTTATPEAARTANVEFRAGVLIQELTSNRVARRVPPGSVIVSVMDEPVSDVEEFIAAMANRDLSPMEGVMVTIIEPNGDTTPVRLYLLE